MAMPALTATALAATALAASSCGSSKPLTRAELTVKANAICKKVSAKLASATKGGVGTKQALARVAPKLAAFEETALGELGKLVPPANLENDWKQFVAGAQTLADNTSKLGEYVKANNLKGAKGLVLSSEATQKQMVAIARRNGFKDCEQVA
jgi:hypothetical protein